MRDMLSVWSTWFSRTLAATSPTTSWRRAGQGRTILCSQQFGNQDLQPPDAAKNNHGRGDPRHSVLVCCSPRPLASLRQPASRSLSFIELYANYGSRQRQTFLRCCEHTPHSLQTLIDAGRGAMARRLQLTRMALLPDVFGAK